MNTRTRQQKRLPEVVKSIGHEKVQQPYKQEKVDIASPDNVGSDEKTTSNKKSDKPTFPKILYKMVEAAEREGFDHVVSWTPEGYGCIVHDPVELEKTILPRFFNHSKVRSFHRQFSFWGFKRDRGTNGRKIHGKGASISYSHPYFSRSNPSLVKKVLRKNETKGTSKKMGGVYINLRHGVDVDNAVTALLDSKPKSNGKKKKTTTNGCNKKRKSFDVTPLPPTTTATSIDESMDIVPLGVVSSSRNANAQVASPPPKKKVRRVSTCNQDDNKTALSSEGNGDEPIIQDASTSVIPLSSTMGTDDTSTEISDNEKESLRVRLVSIYSSLEEAEQMVLNFKKRLLQSENEVHVVLDDICDLQNDPFNVDDFFNGNGEDTFDALAHSVPTEMKWETNIPVASWC